MDHWIIAATFVICATASTGVATIYFHQKEYSRRKLCLESKARAAQLAAFGIGLLSVSVLLMLLIPFGMRFLLIAPTLAWVVTYVITHRGYCMLATPEGTEADYQRLALQFPLNPITSDEEYEQACAFRESMENHNELARQCGNLQERLSKTQWRYMHKLEDVLHVYRKKHPRLSMGQEWYDNVQGQIAELEALLREAHALEETKGLRTAGATEHLRSAEFEFMGLDWIKSVLEGPQVPEGDRLGYYRLKLDLRDMDTQLAKRIKSAREAVRLLKAKEAGQIKYDEPVRHLIVRAARCTDFSECEALLKRAVFQAQNPDADTQTTDLACARRALGQVYQYHLGKPAEAVELYLQVADLLKTEEERYDTQLDLAAAHCTLNQWGIAENVLKELAKTYRQHMPVELSRATDAQEQLALLYISQGRMDDAESILVDNLWLCERHDCDMRGGVETGRALECMIHLYVKMGLFRDAAKFVDRAMRLDPDLDSRTGEQLRTYAQAFKQVGREQEVAAYRFEERAQRHEVELARYKEEQKYEPAWNVLKNDVDQLLLSDL
ncbi:MAG: hypothetical protein K2Z81_00175 [Cyanobacteria bacterium]|nr:hypothetical protein [Cyanobacteriota bacterium]